MPNVYLISENLSSGFPSKRDSNHSPQLRRLARILKFLLKQIDMILSSKRIKKALISLRGCAGWSVTVLFAPPDRFCRHEAHLVLNIAISDLKYTVEFSLEKVHYLYREVRHYNFEISSMYFFL